MRIRIVKLAAMAAAMCIGALACGSGPATSEVVGVSKHRLTPTTFDLPDHGEHKIRTGFIVPGSGEPGPGQQVGICFFTRLKGPFIGVAGDPAWDDDSNNPDLDAFASVLPDETNEIIFEISDNGVEASASCVALADFQNAGKMEHEAGWYQNQRVKRGDGFANNLTVPSSSLRPPSFCTLNYVQGNFYLPYGTTNCTDDAFVGVDTDGAPARTNDSAILGAKGNSCPGWSHPPFGGSQPTYTSRQVGWAGCLTTWSEQPGTYHLVKFGPVNVASTNASPYGVQLMPEADGFCWLNSIRGHEFGSTEEAYVSVHNSGGTDYWYVYSTTSGTAQATCILTDQQ